MMAAAGRILIPKLPFDSLLSLRPERRQQTHVQNLWQFLDRQLHCCRDGLDPASFPIPSHSV
jgi:hypothetical protein